MPYHWGNDVTNVFTGDFDGNGGWDIGVTGTREQGYRKWHIRPNARGGIVKTSDPPRITQVGHPERVMDGELVRVTVQAESRATRAGPNYSSAYYRAFGEGAEGGVATAPGKCCRFAVKFEGHDVPIRNARIRLFRWAGPAPIEWGGIG
jgi:hypothetical protein